VIYLLCHDCKKGLRISPGEPGEAGNLFAGFVNEEGICRCFICQKPIARFYTAGVPDALGQYDTYDVTPQEAFAALNGLGLPLERDCSATAVSCLFEQKRVEKVRTRPIRNSHRCILEWVQFEDGTRAYFGSSALGATIYRISPRHLYETSHETSNEMSNEVSYEIREVSGG